MKRMIFVPGNLASELTFSCDGKLASEHKEVYLTLPRARIIR